MKQIFVMFALLLGVCAANAQTTDTVKYAAGNNLYRGITRKLPYRQMVTPYGVEVTFAKTVHIIFPAAVRYVDLGSNHIIAGKADGAENVIRVKATTEGFPGETNFSVICEDGSFFSFNAKYAREPEMLNIEMKDFLENEDTSDLLDAVRSYNEVIEIAGKSTVRTVYALPKFTIPDDKLLLVELYEKNGGRHQVIRVENADIVNAEVINELKIK